MEEFMARFVVFRQNLNEVKLTLNKVQTWTEGITQFSDLTEQEFRKTYLNLDIDALSRINYEPVQAKRVKDAPESFNWMEKGVLGPIKNQQSCGSCWAFSTIGNIEGLWAIKTGENLVLSEQFLVDCDTNDSGCRGGLMERTFSWLKQNGGLMLEADYPYVGIDQNCHDDKSKYVEGLDITGYQKLGKSTSTFSPVDEDEVRDFLLETGPLAIALNASPLRTYTGGIADYTRSQCSPSGMNHAVVLVGYGTENGLDYWIVRNSWGATWGEEGFFRIARGKGTCGINTYITTALLK